MKNTNTKTNYILSRPAGSVSSHHTHTRQLKAHERPVWGVIPVRAFSVRQKETE